MNGIILTASSGSVTVTRTLYGPVTPEGYTKELLDVKRRAYMLNIWSDQLPPDDGKNLCSKIQIFPEDRD